MTTRTCECSLWNECMYVTTWNWLGITNGRLPVLVEWWTFLHITWKPQYPNNRLPKEESTPFIFSLPILHERWADDSIMYSVRCWRIGWCTTIGKFCLESRRGDSHYAMTPLCFNDPSSSRPSYHKRRFLAIRTRTWENEMFLSLSKYTCPFINISTTSTFGYTWNRHNIYRIYTEYLCSKTQTYWRKICFTSNPHYFHGHAIAQCSRPLNKRRTNHGRRSDSAKPMVRSLRWCPNPIIQAYRSFFAIVIWPT